MKLNFIKIITLFLLICGLAAVYACKSDSDVVTARVTETGEIASWPPVLSDADSTDYGVASNLLAVNYLVVLDGSGSMDERECSGKVTKEKAAEAALEHFVRLIPDDANIGLVAFDWNGITERFPLSRVGDSRESFIAAMRAVGADSGTPLETAITLGYQKIEEQGRKQFGYGEYHLVVVTDGHANYGEDPEDIVEYIIKRSPVVIHTIGFCIGTGHSLNQPGRIFYKAADSPEELEKGLTDVIQAESETFQDAAEFTE